MQRISSDTAASGQLSAEFLIKYEIVDQADQTLKSHNINSFYILGISDPFPEDTPQLRRALKKVAVPDESLLFESEDQLVYESSRYVLSYSPYMVYIPRKELMFKMMRACISVKGKADLWLNKTPILAV